MRDTKKQATMDLNRILKIIGYILLICSIFLFGLKGMTAEMGIAVAASALFLAFVNLDKFKKFKGAGFEAELKQTIEEANATIENLKEVAKPLIETNYILLAKANRFPAAAFDKSHEVFDQLIKLQLKIGLVDTSLEKAKSSYINIHAWDMVNDISQIIELPEQNQFFIKFRETIGNTNYKDAPNIKKFKELLLGKNLNPDCKRKLSLLDDYYEKNQL